MGNPNIILIVCDDLGYGEVGCYGSTINRTPAIDGIAEAGLKLTDFYVTSPVCSPSRSSIMTGCYPQRIGLADGPRSLVLMPGDDRGLSTQETTMAGICKSAGYATACIGKWHLGDQPEFFPTKHGFDSFFGFPYSNDMLPDHPLSERIHFPPLPLLEDEEIIEWSPDQANITERYTARAVDFIDNHAKEPFFLYLAHMYVHEPLYVQQRFLDSASNGVYGAAVETVDWSTGQILEALRRNGIQENTLVIFTSDNGADKKYPGASNAPLRGWKGETYEGGMRAPCLMQWPDRIPAGTICREITSTLDLVPTVSAITGARDAPELPIDGADLSQLLAEPETRRSPRQTMAFYSENTLEALRWRNWKLHLKKHSGFNAATSRFAEYHEVKELYNLGDDPGEVVNLYEQRADIVHLMQPMVDEIQTTLGDDGVPGCESRKPGVVSNAVPLDQHGARGER